MVKIKRHLWVPSVAAVESGPGGQSGSCKYYGKNEGPAGTRSRSLRQGPPDGERQTVRVSLEVYLEGYESVGVKGEEAQRGKWGEEEGGEERRRAAATGNSDWPWKEDLLGRKWVGLVS